MKKVAFAGVGVMALVVWLMAGVTQLPPPAGGPGGNPAFNAITTGVNASASMTVGTGASLGFSGSGTLNANQFNGNSVIAIVHGGTGQALAADAFNALAPTTTLGDLIYRGATGNVRLPGQITTSKYLLCQTGTGTESAAPAWCQLIDGDIPNTITLDNITQITSRSHTSLSDIGSNTHPQIDTHLGAAAPHTGHSGTGACTNQFVSAVNGQAAPTCASVSSSQLVAANKTGQVTYSFFDTATDLPNTIDVPSIYPNRARAITITEVYCEIDAGSASINLQRDDGTPANILSGDLACSAAGATTTTFVGGETAIAVGQNIDHVTVSVGTGQKRLNVAIKYTVD